MKKEQLVGILRGEIEKIEKLLDSEKCEWTYKDIENIPENSPYLKYQVGCSAKAELEMVLRLLNFLD
jgi:hypothetical protein